MSTADEDINTPAAPGSVLDLIRRVRDETAVPDEPLCLTVRAYEDRLALRFDYPEGGWGQLRKAGGSQQQGRRARQNDEAELDALCDTMVTCCTGIVEVVKGKPEKEWPSVDPSGNDIRLTRRFAELVDIDVPSDLRRYVGRFILRHLYSPHAARTGIFRGDVALTSDAIELSEWLDNGGQRVADELPGK